MRRKWESIGIIHIFHLQMFVQKSTITYETVESSPCLWIIRFESYSVLLSEETLIVHLWLDEAADAIDAKFPSRQYVRELMDV